MYEAHFGLTSRPFGSKAEGTGVFTGPRQVEVMTSLKKALAAQDAVVTVTGPVGVGKTTIVNRALDTISPGRMAAWVGRMQLAPDDVLELLLAGFGISRQGRGTIQCFGAFRRLLAERAAAGTPVAIVVEDALRIGNDALVELEALTAADAGDGTGASIILMGQPALREHLSRPELARMKQRMRLRQEIQPLGLAEVQGYLKHCIRAAGGEYDRIFGPGVAAVVHDCSEGIPRVMNTLCESVLGAAMEAGQSTVTASLVHKVAVEAFGYDGPLPAVTGAPAASVADTATRDNPPAAAAPAVPLTEKTGTERPAPATGATARDTDVSSLELLDEADLPPAARNIVVESGRYPELPDSPADLPLGRQHTHAAPADPAREAPPGTAGATDSSAADGSADEDEFEIPALINDTQPELSRLSVSSVSDDAAHAAHAAEAPAVKPQDAAPAAANTKVPDDQEEDGGSFDLDAALSIDTEDTNVMKAVTPDLDAIAGAAGQDAANEAGAPAQPAAPAAARPPVKPAVHDDLPTLSDSMRVDIDAEVGKARQSMKNDAAATPAAATNARQSAPVPAAPRGPTAAAAPRSGGPAAGARRAAAATASPATATPPPAGSDIARELSTGRKPALQQAASQPLKTAAVPDDSPAAPTEDDLFTLEPDLELLEELAPTSAEPIDTPPATTQQTAAAPAKARGDSGPAPAAKVSEMTARIATLDLARSKNDVDALEAALEAAKKGELEQMLEAAAAPSPLPGEVAAVEVPEITLDSALAARQPQKPATDPYAEQIGKANSLEEFSDAMAETLFGDQSFEEIAAAVCANPPEGYQAKGTPAGEEAGIDAAPANGRDLEPPASARREAQPGAVTDGLHALVDLPDAADGGAIGTPPAAGDTPAAARGPQPEPIENQFNSSMTQTLEALNVTKAADDIVEEEEKKSGGFFSRFRRSS